MTSSAVTSLPLWNVAPLRNLNIQVAVLSVASGLAGRSGFAVFFAYRTAFAGLIVWRLVAR